MYKAMNASHYIKRLALKRWPLRRLAFFLGLLVLDLAKTYSEELSLEPLFRFPLGGVVSSGPVLSGKRLWVLSDSKILYSITTEGVASGKRSIPSRHIPFMLADPCERLAIVDDSNSLSLLNKAGQEVWKTSLKARPAFSPFFSGDGCLFVPFDKGISAYAPNGRELWRKSFSSGLSASPLSGPGGGPLLALKDGSIHLFSAYGGLVKSVSFSAPAALLSCNQDSILAALQDNSLVIMDSGLGPGPSGSFPVIKLAAKAVAAASAKSMHFVLDSGGNILAVDSLGNKLWQLQSGTPFGVPFGLASDPAKLVAFEERLILLSDSIVRSYGMDGSFYRELKLKSSASFPVISESGTVFTGGKDWILYAYKFELPQRAIHVPKANALSLAIIEEAAKEEAFWTLEPYSNDSVQKKLANIEKLLKSGTIEDDLASAKAYCAAIALGKMHAPLGMGAAKTEALPSGVLARTKACELLGMMGYHDAVPFLADVFLYDKEAVVKIAAADAISMIGLDPEGGALRAFAFATEKSLDDRTAISIINAILALYRANGSLDDFSGIMAILRIAGGNYSAAVKSRAEKALLQLKKP